MVAALRATGARWSGRLATAVAVFVAVMTVWLCPVALASETLPDPEPTAPVEVEQETPEPTPDPTGSSSPSESSMPEPVESPTPTPSPVPSGVECSKESPCVVQLQPAAFDVLAAIGIGTALLVALGALHVVGSWRR